jgi:hypothetical protein
VDKLFYVHPFCRRVRANCQTGNRAADRPVARSDRKRSATDQLGDEGYLSRRDSRRSARIRPPVWHVGQYVIS